MVVVGTPATTPVFGTPNAAVHGAVAEVAGPAAMGFDGAKWFRAVEFEWRGWKIVENDGKLGKKWENGYVKVL